jgi:Bifunctional DNA primase/polymerase, N-terminal
VKTHNRLLHAALDYVQRGWSAIALCSWDHRGVGRDHALACTRPGKSAAWPWQSYQERLPKEPELKLYWARCPAANVGVCLGPVSRLIGIDVDQGNESAARLKQLANDDIPPTIAFYTPGGGHRLLYRLPAGACPENRSCRTPDGPALVRILSRGTFTVMPPSIHENGPYIWIPECSPEEQAIAEAPAWLVEGS